MRTSLRWQLVAFTIIRTIFNTLHRMVYPFLAIFARGLGVDLTARSVAGTFGRAMGAFLAPRLYGLGFLAVALGATLFNLLALLAVTRLGKGHD